MRIQNFENIEKIKSLLLLQKQKNKKKMKSPHLIFFFCLTFVIVSILCKKTFFPLEGHIDESKAVYLFEEFVSPYKKSSIKTRISRDEETGRRGLFASESMEELGTFTLSVSYSIIFGMKFTQDFPKYKEWMNVCQCQPSDLQKVVFMHEYLQGNKSMFFNYIQLLPRMIDLAIFWNDDDGQMDLNSFKGTEFYNISIGRQRDIDDSWLSLKLNLFNKYPEDVFKDYDYELFHWTSLIFDSRMLPDIYYGGAALIPCMDMINHKYGVKRNITKTNADDNDDAITLNIYDVKYEKNDEIFMQYGMDEMKDTINRLLGNF